MAATRQRIIVHLKKSGEASVADLSQALSLTSVTVRHHLQELRREGLVADPTPRRRQGPGRPEMGYRLLPHARVDLPRNYRELCSCLVEELSGELAAEALADVLVRAGQDLSRSWRSQSDMSRPSRRERTERFLEARGYLPRWVQERDGLRLQLANCPYHEIAQRFPEMCRFDEALLEGLMDTEVKLEASIAAMGEVCSFHLAGDRWV